MGDCQVQCLCSKEHYCELKQDLIISVCLLGVPIVCYLCKELQGHAIKKEMERQLSSQ